MLSRNVEMASLNSYLVCLSLFSFLVAQVQTQFLLWCGPQWSWFLLLNYSAGVNGILNARYVGEWLVVCWLREQHSRFCHQGLPRCWVGQAALWSCRSVIVWVWTLLAESTFNKDPSTRSRRSMTSAQLVWVRLIGISPTSVWQCL